MARRRWKWLLAVGATPLLIWGYDRVQQVYWVGSTDLEIEFAVVEVDSAKPIPGGRVEVQSEGGFYEEREKREFVLVADAGGVARKECRNSMCFGTQSGLRFTDTFVVHLPWWRYRAVAEGYGPSDWAELDVIEFRRQVQQTNPGKARLVVRVPLSRRHP